MLALLFNAAFELKVLSLSLTCETGGGLKTVWLGAFKPGLTGLTNLPVMYVSPSKRELCDFLCRVGAGLPSPRRIETILIWLGSSQLVVASGTPFCFTSPLSSACLFVPAMVHSSVPSVLMSLRDVSDTADGFLWGGTLDVLIFCWRYYQYNTIEGIFRYMYFF